MRRVLVAVVAALVMSPLPGIVGLPRAGAVTSISDPATVVNAPATDSGGRFTQADSSLAVLGTNVVAAFTDSGSSAGPPPITHFTGWARSTNSGKSFTDMGTLPASAMGDGGHPSLAVNTAKGFIYLSTVGQTIKSQAPVFRSADGGATWGAAANATPGYASGTVGNQVIAVDNFAGACQGNVYLGYMALAGPAGMKLSRSTDDGVTWTPNQGVSISNDLGGDPSIVVGPDHAVYFFWLSNFGNVVMMRRSTDCGVTFGDPVDVADLAVTTPQGDLGLEGGVASNSFPRASVDPVTGGLYVAVSDVGSASDKADVYFTSSTNSGATWTALQDLTGGMAGSQWAPAIALSKTGKAVMVSFDDSYHNTQGLLVVRRYDRLGTASAGALALAPALPTSPEFPIVVGQDSSVASGYMGTYDAIAPLGTGFVNTWTDTRDQSDGPDVRYERVPATGKADVAVTLTGPATVNYATPVTITATVSDLSTTKAADVVYLQLNPDSGLLPVTATTGGGACYFTDIPPAVTCHVGRLNPGQSRTVKLTAKGFTLGTHHTSATVGSSLPDPAAANNTAQLTTTVVSPFTTDKASLVNDPNRDPTASDTQSGPAAAAIGNTVVVAYEDTGSPGNHHIGWSRSTDGGTTFTDMGALPDSTVGDTGRPAVTADPTDGSFYIAAQTASADDTQVFRSTDGGATFGPPVAIGVPTGTSIGRTLPSMAVDTTGGPCTGTIYLAARTQANASSYYGHDLFASSDHGTTWTRRWSGVADGPPGVVASAPGLAVGKFGEVYLVWSSGSQLRMATSTVQSCGGAFASPVTVSADATFATQFGVVVNPTTNAVFVAFTYGSPSTVSVTVGSGGTFSAPVALSESTAPAYQPDLAFSGNGSRILVSWIRSPDGGGAHATWFDRIARLGTVNGTTLQFGNEFATGPAALGGVPDDPRGVVGFSSGDAIVQSGSSFVSFWGEARDASPFHQSQFDVRFARVPVTGGGAADLGVTLSDSADPITQGDATGLTATVTNPSGTAAQFTELNIDMPPELAASTATAVGGTCYSHPRFVTCLLGRVPAHASRTVTINAIAIQTGTVSTTATVTSSAADPNVSDNTATTATTLTAGTTAPVVANSADIYAISDLQTARVPMTVSGTGGRVLDVNVSIRLNHTYDGDLVVSLEAPDHTTVTLVARAGGAGANFGTGANDCTGTTTNLDDSAGQDYYLASAPFNGTYRPVHPLADLHGVAADGTWTLRVTDAKTGDQGVVGCAKISLTTA